MPNVQTKNYSITRRISPQLTIKKGDFGRPVAEVYGQDQKNIGTALKRLKEINQLRLEIRNKNKPRKANYFILIPTLRCNLDCSYCQVSRAAQHAVGYDWSEETVKSTIDFICEKSDTEITVEFQGGEPLLRLDIIKIVEAELRNRGKQPTIVICTNLQNLSRDAWQYLVSSDAMISTSFDGSWEQHNKLRTQDVDKLEEFKNNLKQSLNLLGHDRTSIVSTVDPRTPPEPTTIFKNFQELGANTIFIRPINFQGFARKYFKSSRNDEVWDEYYIHFLEELLEYNKKQSSLLTEYYFSYIVKRVLDPRRCEHVDLRNPAWLGHDYFVIGEKGDIFPTDEARMLYRLGQIDLRIGHVDSGLDEEKITLLNRYADNRNDADCRECVYQAVCGRDLIDDISRYGRFDIPRHETRHCKKHLSIFDFVMKKLSSANDDEIALIANMVGLNSINTEPYKHDHA